MYFIGFDIGGSSTKAVLVENKKIIKSEMRDTPKSLDEFLVLIVEMKNELSAGVASGEIGGIGFGIAGTLNKSRDSVLRSYNIKYLDSQPIKKILAEKLEPYPIKIEQDIYCFLSAEKEVGLARNLSSVFYLTIGCGIGAGWMVNGQIQVGAHGGAGEGGHMIIDAEKGLDLDELEELAANKFIVKMLGFSSNEAIKRAQAGDKKVQETLAQLGKNLGIGITNVINIFDPEAVILSGGIAEAKDFILPGIEEGIKKFVISPAAKETKILFSALGRFGGALGAALMVSGR